MVEFLQGLCALFDMCVQMCMTIARILEHIENRNWPILILTAAFYIGIFILIFWH